MDCAKFAFRAKSKCRATCAVKHCTSRLNKDLDVIFHSFPSVKRIVTQVNGLGNLQKIDQVKAWKKALNIKSITSSTRICSLHFKKDDYILPDIPVKCRKLKRNAIPTNNLPNAIALDKSRETRLIRRHEKSEKIMEELQVTEDSLAENCSNTSSKEFTSAANHSVTNPNIFNTGETPWYPKPHDRICSSHFIGGKKDDKQASPSYIPTIFPEYKSTTITGDAAVLRGRSSPLTGNGSNLTSSKKARGSKLKTSLEPTSSEIRSNESPMEIGPGKFEFVNVSNSLTTDTPSMRVEEIKMEPDDLICTKNSDLPIMKIENIKSEEIKIEESSFEYIDPAHDYCTQNILLDNSFIKIEDIKSEKIDAMELSSSNDNVESLVGEIKNEPLL